MASVTLQRMENVLSQIFATPMAQVLAELQEISDGDPRNPAPHLAMAIVTFFTGDGLNTEQVEAHLDQAARLLAAGGPGDAEWAYSENLHKLLTSEREMAHLPRRQVEARDIEAFATASRREQGALAEMGRLAGQIPGSALPVIMHAAMQVLARAAVPGSGAFRAGMATLARTFNQRLPGSDLAGYFRMYGFKQARDSLGAINLGQQLVQRNPNNPLANKLLGRALFKAHRDAEARTTFRRAIDLAPADPTCYLGYASVLQELGQLQDARAALEQARVLDVRNELGGMTSILDTRVSIADRLRPL